jgi:hypothetical protein
METPSLRALRFASLVLTSSLTSMSCSVMSFTAILAIFSALNGMMPCQPSGKPTFVPGICQPMPMYLRAEEVRGAARSGEGRAELRTAGLEAPHLVCTRTSL